MQDKKVSFDQLSENASTYTAEGDPNRRRRCGASCRHPGTPVMAQDIIRRIREVTDKPIRYVVLTHYPAGRVLGAAAYSAQELIAGKDTRDLIAERGAQDLQSEMERFPRRFRVVRSVPGLS